MMRDSNDICRQLECWYQKPAGRYLLEREQALVAQQLDKVFGYHLLQLGVTGNQPLGLDTALNHKIYATLIGGPGTGLMSELDSLPFPNDSIDAVVVHHCMEFADNPHQLLREVQRILAPQGHVVVVGFNPWSPVGAGLRIRRYLPQQLWRHARPMGVHRLRDWLHLLGSEVESVAYTYSFPPVGGERLHHGLARLDGFTSRHNWLTGGVYVLHAQKQVSGLTPTRLSWETKVGNRLIGLAVPKPVASPCEGDVAA
jgi:SAM-dependent methyltransferase